MNTRAQRILIVEDDPTIAGAIAARLQSEGFVIELASDGLQAVSLCLATPPDLIVLDLMLPGIDGYEVCRRVQAVHSIPVLMLTARQDENDMLVGLGVGADDYLTKPFSPRELVARIRAILRRVERVAATTSSETQGIRYGDLTIDSLGRRVMRAEEPVELTRTEFDLVLFLVEQPNRVFTREQLLAAVWNWPDASSRTVDSHVKSLRRKLGPDIVRTVHGVGYAAGRHR